MKNIRLSKNEGNAILECVLEANPKALVYLFGSRVYLDKKGGDIDLLVLSEAALDKIKLLVEIKSRIGEQKIDILILTHDELRKNAFATKVKSEAVLLNDLV